jgi:hypothetical protein
MPSKRCIQGLVGTRLTPTQFRAMNDTFDIIMHLTFAKAREEAIQRANGRAITISTHDVQKVLRDLSVK